jgi:hypothetical protein
MSSWFAETSPSLLLSLCDLACAIIVYSLGWAGERTVGAVSFALLQCLGAWLI